MIGYIYTHPFVFVIVIFIVLLVLAYYFIKSLSVKSKGTDKKQEKIKPDMAKKSDEKQEQESVETEKNEDNVEQETKPVLDKNKKPQVTHIYKREAKVETATEKYDPIYDRNVEFVNTSKNIAKFKSFSDEVKKEETPVDEYGFVTDKQEDCEFCENKVKHFDHSRRLSKIVSENNFDEMYVSHLSEKYMNIDANKHIDLSENFDQKLYDRTSKMISNSNKKILSNIEDSKREFVSEMIVNSDEDDDENLDLNIRGIDGINLKSLMISDSVLKRKGKK